MTIVPIDFEVEDGCEISDLLERTTNNGIVSVKWKTLNIEILFTDSEENQYWPNVDDIKKHTSNFKLYKKLGFTIDNYSEFLIVAFDWKHVPKIIIEDNNGVEITIGELTPIGHYIFDIFHEYRYHGDFEYFQSIRIYGCDSENVEVVLLNVLNKLIFEYNFSFNLLSLDIPDYEYPEEKREDEVKIEKIKLKTNFDLIPNRFFYKGLKENDSSNAFLDFYRILEYYSIIILESDVDKLRNDSTISKREFVLKMNRITNDNEKALLGKLIDRISDSILLKHCENQGLIDKDKPELLATKLYEFRNSIVHSKMNQKLMPIDISILETDEKLEKWEFVCRDLAHKAMNKT
ncbi:hypothetical protein [Lacihabitans lacunae]|uniref:Apea-like HEPN domain-containing protein n=1 Tax=Lacihabitans lacunae TaxID=1028214 RepID=A0ABV7YWT9_9BACT